MKRYCIFWLFIYPLALSGQINMGPRITALGSTGVALQDVWSLQSNQAGLAAIKNIVISAAYQNRYLNPELSTKSAVIVYPVKRNVFGLSFQSYGFSAYKEQKIGLSYAKSFGKTLFAALNFNYHQVTIPQYGSARTYSAEAGIQYFVNDRLLLGGHITNPGRNSYGNESGATVPASIEFGAAYQFTDKLLLNTGLEKNLNAATDFKAGIEYSVVNWLALRGGISVHPFCQHAGFGFSYHRLRFDAAASSHPQLGFSPQISMAYEL